MLETRDWIFFTAEPEVVGVPLRPLLLVIFIGPAG